VSAGNWGPPGSSPWADPTTPTEPGPPYGGPPPMQPAFQPHAGQPAGWGYPAPYGTAPYGTAPYGTAPYGTAPYGTAPWGPVPPRRPQRPGQVITAAVLAFAQATVVMIASLYLWFFASIAELAASGSGGVWAPGRVDALAAEGTVLAIVQLLSAVLLVGAGVWALNRRTRAPWRLLVAALAVQLVLAGYWTVRLMSELGGVDTGRTIISFALFFAAGPLVGLGMLLVGPGRRWFGGVEPATGEA
jgi:hypothetical protein